MDGGRGNCGAAVDGATDAAEQHGRLGLVVGLQAGAGDDAVALGDGHRGVGARRLVVGDDVQHAGGESRRQPAAEGFAHDLHIAFQAHLLAVGAEPCRFGGDHGGRRAVVGEARGHDFRAVVVRVMHHLLGHQRMLQRALRVEAAHVEAFDDEIRVVARATVAAGLLLGRLFQPEGQCRQQAQQADGEEGGAAGPHAA